MQHLLKFCQLAPADRRLLFEAAFTLAVTRLALWCLPFRVWSARPAPPLGSSDAPQPKPARLAWAVATAARVVPCATCLVQALAARRMFAHHGYPSSVRIGVANSREAGFAAHAWLEHEGSVLAGSATGPFTPLHSL